MLKKLISYTLRRVPRPILQRIAHVPLKAASVFMRGNQVECPVCTVTFSKFLPYGRNPARENALCPNCLSLERHRLMWLFLKSKTDFFEGKNEVLHIAPEMCFIKPFEALLGEKYITADLVSPLAKVKLDVHEMPFEDNRFDVVFCNHVMEHVADDIKAMKEIYRVLKPEGWAILQIPLFHPLPEQTQEDPAVTDPKEREKLYGQDDHVRLYGKDYADRIRSAGFDVEESKFVQELTEEEVNRYALPKEETIFYCKKK